MKARAKSSASSSRAASPPAPSDLFDLLAGQHHEQVSLYHEPSSGYRGIIAIHDTTLGPAVGGTRFWSYASDRDALLDALRLARAMTYKCAVAGLDLGGGKAVMVGDNRTPRREALFRAHGRHIHRLGGRYITAEDVGTAPADMAYVRAETPHVTGLPGKSGDPSPLTAYGVYRGMQACARRRWGADSLAGRRVAIQGVGNVGYHLARLLQRGGAKLVVTDVDAARVKRVVDEFQAEAVRPEEIYGVRAEIFAPCALGGVIDDDTVGRLAVEIVAGGANNPLAEPWHGDALEARGVTYAPDFVVNSGGVINLDAERNGWPAERAREKADQIYDTVLRVLDLARAEGIPSYRAAERLAEQRIANVRRNSG